MPKLLSVSEPAIYQGTDLPAPQAGELAQASVVEEALQQLLDNTGALEQALKNLPIGPGPLPVQVQKLAVGFDNLQKDVQAIRVLPVVPMVGLICAVSVAGTSGRVVLSDNKGNPDDPQRGLFAPPAPGVLAIADVGINLNVSSELKLSPPIPYAIEAVGSPVSIRVGLTPWSEQGTATVTLSILPLGSWGSDQPVSGPRGAR